MEMEIIMEFVGEPIVRMVDLESNSSRPSVRAGVAEFFKK